jgi:DNA-nicking Smr family endonuclease
MKPAPDVEDLRLWSVVAATVRPLRPAPYPPAPPAPASPQTVAPKPAAASRVPAHPPAAPPPKPRPPRPPPADLEPGRHHRLARGRELLAARIDLHGLTHDQARAALTGFIERSVAQDWRAVLVITGKGAQGDGVLRRRVPDWLAEPPIRQHVAGVSEAHRRHGGEGALYVALKRRG